MIELLDCLIGVALWVGILIIAHPFGLFIDSRSKRS